MLLSKPSSEAIRRWHRHPVLHARPSATSVVVRVTRRPACSPHCSTNVKMKYTTNPRWGHEQKKSKNFACEDNWENFGRMKVLWLSLSLWFIFSILLDLCSLCVCCPFYYKMRLKKDKKIKAVGWSLSVQYLLRWSLQSKAISTLRSILPSSFPCEWRSLFTCMSSS